MSDKTYIRGSLFAGLLTIYTSAFLWVGTINAQQVSLEPAKGHDPVTRTFDATNNQTIVSVMPDFMRNLAVALLANSPVVQPSPTHQTVEFTLRAVSYTYTGTVPARPQTVNFIFVSDGRKPKYKDTPDFEVDADGSAANGKIDYDLKDSSFGKVEVLRVPVPTELFLRIARASKVQFSFGTKTYKLSGAQKKDVRALADTVP